MTFTSVESRPADLPGPEYKRKLLWKKILYFIFLHAGTVYAIFTMNTSFTVVYCKKSQTLKRNLW